MPAFTYFIHHACAHLRLNGEWFRPAGSLDGLISDLIPVLPDVVKIGRFPVPVGSRLNAIGLAVIVRNRFGAYLSERRMVNRKKNPSRVATWECVNLG